MKIIQKILSIAVLALLPLISTAKADVVKFKTIITNQYDVLSEALAFIYLEDSLIGAEYADKNGVIKLELERDKEYKITVSKPGHIATTVEISTKSLFRDEVIKVTLPIRLYNLRDNDIDRSLVSYRIKWNPILERFETFGLNLGWIDEIKEKAAEDPDFYKKK